MAYGNGGYQLAQANGPAPMQPMPPKTSEIFNELDMLEKATHVLHEIVGQLEGRLCAVLAPEPPNGEGTGVRPTCTTTLGQCIGANTDRIGAAISRLRVLMDRTAL